MWPRPGPSSLFVSGTRRLPRHGHADLTPSKQQSTPVVLREFVVVIAADDPSEFGRGEGVCGDRDAVLADMWKAHKMYTRRRGLDVRCQCLTANDRVETLHHHRAVRREKRGEHLAVPPIDGIAISRMQSADLRHIRCHGSPHIISRDI